MRPTWLLGAMCAFAWTCCVSSVARADAGGAATPAAQQSSSPKYAIKAGKIVTMKPKPVAGDSRAVEVINHGLILVSAGKIEAIRPTDANVPQGYTVIDASDRWAMPGIVESHTHVGTEGGFNDMVVSLNPELCISDCVDPEDIAVRKAVTGGVTTIHTMPGSGTNIAGFTVIVKTAGATPEERIVRKLGAMKIANAYNPERDGGDLGRTRMAMSWMVRYMLEQAREYTEAWRAYEQDNSRPKPQLKPELENMRQAFEGKIPTIIHTCEGWGVMQAIRIFGDENKLRIIVTHGEGGGYTIGREAAKRDNVSVNVGPRLVDHTWGAEYDGRMHGIVSEYCSRGVDEMSINTDSVGWSSYIAPQEELCFQASMAARLGIDDLTAMKGITINSARALGIDDRVGSLEVGKDADIVIKKGTHLDVASPVDLVLIDGKIAYQRHGANLVADKSSPTRQKESQS